MTPSAFVARFGALADQAAAGTGLSRWTILVQWAVESGWGTSTLSTIWHNQAGIRWYGHRGTVQVGGITGKIGSGFAGYADDAAFLADYVHTMALPYYDAVRATAGAPVPDQLAALAASSWDAGHYAGGGLSTAWAMLGGLADMLAIVTATPFPEGPRRFVVRAGATLSGYDPAQPGQAFHTTKFTQDSMAHADAVVAVAWPGAASPPIPRGGPFLRVVDGTYQGLLVVAAYVDVDLSTEPPAHTITLQVDGATVYTA